MGFLKQEVPVLDFEQWSKGTRSEKIRPMARHWAEVGFGTPVALHLFYVLKILAYIAVAACFALATKGIDGWSNIGGEGVYPSLDNPYVPSAEVPKIVGEKDVDSDSDQLAQWGDNDTWPNLQNPYSKASVTPKEAK